MEEGNSFWLIGDFKLFEPVTIITNLIISALCIIFFIKIRKNQLRKDINSWRLFFLHIGISSFLGSFYHGIHDQLGANFYSNLNIVRNIFSLTACFYCFRATLFYVKKNEGSVKTINIVLSIYILAAIILTVVLNTFMIVTINAAIFVLYTLFAHIYAFRKGSKGSGWILASFGIAPIPITVHILKIGVSDFFNSKDIAHIFMWISLWFLYRGVISLSKSDFRLEKV